MKNIVVSLVEDWLSIKNTGKDTLFLGSRDVSVATGYPILFEQEFVFDLRKKVNEKYVITNLYVIRREMEFPECVYSRERA